MSEPISEGISELVQRIRTGDDQAAAELVRRYEPIIRREVRMRLSDRRLARLADSMDLCQSVLGSFFVRAAVGQYDLEGNDDILRLLVTLARNKVASAARHQFRQRRDARRTQPSDQQALGAIAADLPSPSRIVAGRELLELVRSRLGDQERAVADLRAGGWAWGEIADRLGGTPQARRMQLVRAVDRVARELGLDEAPHE